MKYSIIVFIAFTIIIIVLKTYSNTQLNNFGKEVCQTYGAKPGDAPWQVYIEGSSIIDNGTIVTSCGGALISSNSILTSASCIETFDAFSVQLGTLKDHPLTIQYLNSANVVIHARYNATDFKHDIAIIKLNNDIYFNNLIKPILLPRATHAVVNYFSTSYAVLSGWGVTFDDKLDMKCLISVLGHVISQEQCSSKVSKLLHVSSICSYGIGGSGNSPCVVDNGGPLVTFDNEEDNSTKLYSTMILIGVLSSGHTKCSSNEPNVYTATAFYVDWIERITTLPVRN